MNEARAAIRATVMVGSTGVGGDLAKVGGEDGVDAEAAAKAKRSSIAASVMQV